METEMSDYELALTELLDETEVRELDFS